MDVKYCTQSLVTIEYPGTVINLDNMTKTLGGETQMWSTFNNPSKRLELKFRPDDPHCKCVHGNLVKTTNLILKVIKRTKKSSKKNSLPIETEPSFKVEFLGVSNATYKFQNMVDFQILPTVFDKQRNDYKSLIPDIVPEGLLSHSWLNQEIELFVPPLMYSRFDAPQSGYVEPNRGLSTSHSLPENVIGRCRKRRAGFAVFVTFECEEFPAEPNDLALKQISSYPLDLELKQQLVELFNERPIWSRNGLAYRLNVERTRLKYCLPCVACYFTNGPWRTLWVKFGYDPRKTPASKHLQILDFRVNLSNCDTRIQTKAKHLNSNKPCTQNCGSTMTTNLLVPPSQDENVPKDEEIKTRRLLCQFIPGQLPSYRQCFYQFCDIDMESVQALVHANDGLEKTCHEKDGWLEPGVLDKCRELLMADVSNSLKIAEKDYEKCMD